MELSDYDIAPPCDSLTPRQRSQLLFLTAQRGKETYGNKHTPSGRGYYLSCKQCLHKITGEPLEILFTNISEAKRFILAHGGHDTHVQTENRWTREKPATARELAERTMEKIKARKEHP